MLWNHLQALLRRSRDFSSVSHWLNNMLNPVHPERFKAVGWSGQLEMLKTSGFSGEKIWLLNDVEAIPRNMPENNLSKWFKMSKSKCCAYAFFIDLLEPSVSRWGCPIMNASYINHGESNNYNGTHTEPFFRASWASQAAKTAASSRASRAFSKTVVASWILCDSALLLFLPWTSRGSVSPGLAVLVQNTWVAGVHVRMFHGLSLNCWWLLYIITVRCILLCPFVVYIYIYFLLYLYICNIS